jgi:hypothetical protein
MSNINGIQALITLHFKQCYLCSVIVCFLQYCVQMMSGYLQSEGVKVQRDRVRSALRVTDPVGTAKRWAKTVSRRVYQVQMPNSLWHVDSHMKLTRYA